MQEILDIPYMEKCGSILESKLGPKNYVRGLSQLSPGTQPILSNLSSEVNIRIPCYFHNIYRVYLILIQILNLE